jgi:hypothetical protein
MMATLQFVLAACPVGASADLCLRSIGYLPRALLPPVGASYSHAGSRSSVLQLASFPSAYGTVSCKKPINTQRLVPAPFNEFYPKRSGSTIPLRHTIFPPAHFR